MHELSIALSMLDTAAEKVAAIGNPRVSAIHLKLGPLSGVVKTALLSAFEMARQDSIFDQCELVILDTPMIGFCPNCNRDQPIRSPQEIQCAVCGTPTPKIISGRELEVVAMEVCDEHINAPG